MTTATELLFYRPGAIARSEIASQPGVPLLRSYFRAYPIVSPVDSTSTISTPIAMHNAFPLPPFRPYQTSYEDTCDARAQELLTRADALDMPIYVSYSGGIDSTLALVSLLKGASPVQRKRITVLLSEDSIMENPNFYRDHIVGKLTMVPSMRLPLLFGGPGIFVSGELNDQVFGSDVVGSLIRLFGTSVIHAPYDSELMVRLFESSINDEPQTRRVLTILERVLHAAPVAIASNFDALWWFNFAAKWQSVYFRALASVHPIRAPLMTRTVIESQFAPFYGTDAFRLWSMNNMDKRIKDTWESYKWPSKEIIYKYNNDAQYRDHKVKRGSLSRLLRHRSIFNFIDAEYKFHSTLDVWKFYRKDNDFIVT